MIHIKRRQQNTVNASNEKYIKNTQTKTLWTKHNKQTNFLYLLNKSSPVSFELLVNKLLGGNCFLQNGQLL